MTVAAEMYLDINWLRAARSQTLPLLTSGHHSLSRLLIENAKSLVCFIKEVNPNMDI
jgi:hypothetical protein